VRRRRHGHWRSCRSNNGHVGSELARLVGVQIRVAAECGEPGRERLDVTRPVGPDRDEIDDDGGDARLRDPDRAGDRQLEDLTLSHFTDQIRWSRRRLWAGIEKPGRRIERNESRRR
jgi:hypothetical protein